MTQKLSISFCQGSDSDGDFVKEKKQLVTSPLSGMPKHYAVWCQLTSPELSAILD